MSGGIGFSGVLPQEGEFSKCITISQSKSLTINKQTPVGGDDLLSCYYIVVYSGSPLEGVNCVTSDVHQSPSHVVLRKRTPVKRRLLTENLNQSRSSACLSISPQEGSNVVSRKWTLIKQHSLTENVNQSCLSVRSSILPQEGCINLTNAFSQPENRCSERIKPIEGDQS